MKKSVFFAAMAALFALAGCGGVPPGQEGQDYPQESRNRDRYRQDEMECRQMADFQTGGAAASGRDYNAIRQFENAHSQCMYSRGHTTLPPMAAPLPYYPPNPAYPQQVPGNRYPPGYYGPGVPPGAPGYYPPNTPYPPYPPR